MSDKLTSFGTARGTRNGHRAWGQEVRLPEEQRLGVAGYVVPCPPRRECQLPRQFPPPDRLPEGCETLNVVFRPVAAIIAELIAPIEMPATRPREAGYAAVFRRICQRGVDEGFALAESIGAARTTSRSIRSSPRRASRARWSSSTRGVLRLNKSPLSMVAPPFKYARAPPG